MQIRSVGIDLGKMNFQLVALGAAGKELVEKNFTQKQLLAFKANMQTSLPSSGDGILCKLAKAGPQPRREIKTN